MTKLELLEKLKDVPDDANVVVLDYDFNFEIFEVLATEVEVYENGKNVCIR